MVDLSLASLCLITLICCALWVVFFQFHRYNTEHYAKNPSPESYPVIGNLLGFLYNRHRFHDWVADLLATSPSLTIQVNSFLGLSHGICTADPANIEHLLRSNFSNYVKGSRFQSVLNELLGNGIFNVDGEIWLKQRKIASHQFNTKSLKHFISDTVQSQLSNRLIPYLYSACENGELIDLQDVLSKFTFDNICHIAFGVNPSSLDLRKNDIYSSCSSFVRAFDYAVNHSSSRFMLPLPLIWKIKRSLNIGSERRFREAVRIINSFAMNIIKLKEKSCQIGDTNEQESQDLLSRFIYSSSNLEFSEEDDKRKFLRDIVISFMLAGKDSTSTALTWFFWLIAGHSRCERLIYNELSGTSPDESPGIFSYNKLKEFNYLHAALTESLRLFPPVPINSRLTISDDILSSGTFVGKGWFADYSSYAMGRMERLWGANCREFQPERWLDENGVFQASDQFKFPVFHCGPRLCLGKDMAYVQMKSVAAAIMYGYEVIAADGGGRPERISNPPYTLSLLLKMKGGFPVRLRRR
ncbi:hypothetical protein F511_32845 [Dorcoceras hygrometricum]|uniref:Cytochrome P450 94A1-like n=1 Tax=Dorcoceras hygrometricum TaxID=472368 RepID=A0A2Z7A2L9_9LAMI|nr:hypothetical protein F511_32845 [Dorcoceras hygrometricum]